jgi:predicted P-loop ATPase
MLDNTSTTAVEFLQQLRPDGPWVLTAIIPDGSTTTTTAHTGADVAAFVNEYNGTRNIYYSVNPTRHAMSKKAAKADIAAVEYLLADCDPNDGENSDDAKVRYLNALSNGFEPQPTAIIDSGNGIQCLWRLMEPIQLPNDATSIITDVESRTAEIMVRLGAKPGTQNVDRILRLPGTTNLPNAKKLKAGRTPCPTKLLAFHGTFHDLRHFPLPEQKPDPKAKDKVRIEDDEDKLDRIIRLGASSPEFKTRSEGVWFVINEMLRRGYLCSTIATTLLDKDNGISAHVLEHNYSRAYVEKQIAEAKKQLTLATDNKGVVYKTQNNIRVALLKMGVKLRYDEFADRVIIDGLKNFGPVLDDAACDRIWLALDQRFHLQIGKDQLHTVIIDTARLNKFHPVRDYLDGLKWDGVKRIDKWLTTYAQAGDDEYTNTVGALWLVAAVRRIRQPGSKFDEMLIIEQQIQGTDKSSALAALAVKEEWFTDDLPLNIRGKEVIEHLRGKWIIECGELSGMRKADIAHLKAFLSRQTDRARMAYGRIVSEVPRQCVFAGTTNDLEYLKDTTGNRRYWPVHCQRFDVAALKRDRDQLWAEAAARERVEGTSIRLDPKLWASAAEEQELRLTKDPWFNALQEALYDMAGKISMGSIWVILDVHGAQQTQAQRVRVGDAMRALGWDRPNDAGTVKINGKMVSGFVKGNPPWQRVYADRDKERHLHVDLVFEFEDRQKEVKPGNEMARDGWDPDIEL